ncbi:hypothetical protein J3R30DRAFT_1348922 [Lentinula aciculospora]|uniref:F-box domain-containing protein n=1 Tax=Lentinula aciculospora TaxID=153920 RepID=A0A9W9AL39_9AGAR|nr:hypothetical protein J3R30DRAFT_1348922 [Lentinula aciculospora]
MSVSLSSLPLDLLLQIVNEVPRLEDRKSLRRTCLLLGDAFKPHVLSEVTLNIHRDNLNPGISLLQAIVNEREKLNEDSVCKHIRTLNIYSLSPAYFLESAVDFEERLRNLRYTYEVEKQSRRWSKAIPLSDKVAMAERQLQSLLKPALGSLDYLTAIRWRWHSKDSQWTLTSILECLESHNFHRNIKEFTFTYCPSDTHIPILFPNLKHLRVCSITGNLSEADLKKLVQHPMISDNSQLTTLCLSKVDQGYHPGIFFDGHIPTNISSLRLNGLRLASVETIIRRNLTSLELGSVMFTDNASWGSLWDILSLQRIHLRNFAMCHNTRSDYMDKMLDYFQSYSGLESFSLKGPWWYDASLYDVYAVRFYENVLPMHVNSLVNLQIKPEFESKWCFGVDNVDVVRRCKRLRSLCFKVDHRGLEPDINPDLWTIGMLYSDENGRMSVPSGSGNGSSYPNLVHLLLEMISSDLHDLEKLTLEPARNPDWAHDHTDMLFGAQFRLGVQRRLRTSVESFTHNPYNEVLNWVRVYVVDEQVLTLRRSKDGVERKKQEKQTFWKSNRITASVIQKMSRMVKKKPSSESRRK